MLLNHRENGILFSVSSKHRNSTASRHHLPHACARVAMHIKTNTQTLFYYSIFIRKNGIDTKLIRKLTVKKH